MAPLSIVVTDLDGTLLNSEGRVSTNDYNSLLKLGSEGVVRVIATGRTPFSFAKVIPNDFPIDYLIFSSGAGAMEWSTKKILYAKELTQLEVQLVVDEMIFHEVDFMIHEPIPANHRFLYYQTGRKNPDFDRRVELYRPFCQPFIPGVGYFSTATQVLAVLPHDVEWFESLRSRFPTLKVIRATSPLDGHSIWMEIFPSNVSKAYGIEWICKDMGLEVETAMVVGNDFNDLDMLRLIRRSYVVDNAPSELKDCFTVVDSNNNSGFSHAVELALGE